MEQMLCGAKWKAGLICMQLYGLKILIQDTIGQFSEGMVELMLYDIDTILIYFQFISVLLFLTNTYCLFGQGRFFTYMCHLKKSCYYLKEEVLVTCTNLCVLWLGCVCLKTSSDHLFMSSGPFSSGTNGKPWFYKWVENKSLPARFRHWSEGQLLQLCRERGSECLMP